MTEETHRVRIKAKVLGGKCSCGGPACAPKEQGRHRRYQKPKKSKGR